MILNRRRFVQETSTAAAALAMGARAARAWGGQAPQASISGSRGRLGNEILTAEWDFSGGGIHLVAVKAPGAAYGGAVLKPAMPAPVGTLVLGNGAIVGLGTMRVVTLPRIEAVAADHRAARRSEQVSGKRLVALLRDEESGLEATWSAVLREGSHYIRQEVTLHPTKGDLPVTEIRMLELDLTGTPTAPQLVGHVNGSPVTAGPWFMGFEHPLSEATVDGAKVTARITRRLPLRANASTEFSSVIGVTRPGQMRRDVLAYVERERAHPYRTFLHYNSWYDLGYFTPYDEAAALDAINAFGNELHARRGVKLDSFLFDDGWDDHTSLWRFNAGFPHGFTPLKAAAEKAGGAPGVWMSPWGGYGQPRTDRLAYGAKQGFETNRQGFSLSGPVYYQRFHEVCVEMITQYGINQFKFDGTGNSANVTPGSQFDSDFDAAIHLIADLRSVEPSLYVNLTTGTYPSPFWLRYADSTWRGGSDHDFAGVGSDRQQWITYRDADTYRHVVQRGPLYPLNALMLHGLIYARYATSGKAPAKVRHLDTDPNNDFRSEIRAYFGNGTQLQEMYITHSLLSASNWDDIAEAANWSRRNAGTLVDTHWVGGDPNQLEAYGWASWSPGKAVLTLRNPSDKPQTIEIDAAKALELPAGAAQNWKMRIPWKEDAAKPTIELRAGEAHGFELQPFEVLNLESV